MLLKPILKRMDSQLYRRLDNRVRSLSRVSYALLIGLISALCVFAVGSMIFEEMVRWAIPVGVGMAITYYVADPNNEN
jgi:hypothetical protein